MNNRKKCLPVVLPRGKMLAGFLLKANQFQNHPTRVLRPMVADSQRDTLVLGKGVQSERKWDRLAEIREKQGGSTGLAEAEGQPDFPFLCLQLSTQLHRARWFSCPHRCHPSPASSPPPALRKDLIKSLTDT